MSHDFIFSGSITELDPDLKRLLDLENRRQDETIILVASESAAPDAVNEALSSGFGNIYAEGYPREESRKQATSAILDIDAELAHYRRYSDPRYYKGVEYADVLEALTRRRAAELFAANGISADNLFVNVQPLSGAPANNAVYTALIQPGDTIMGLNLNDGGHLSHGASANRTGKLYKSVPYFVDEKTEQLDYDAIEKLALEAKPQIIVAGYSAYPMVVNWQRFRAIADKCGAYLLADIAHISGLVASGVHPSPIGIADVVSTTTHKSLCGPRGAMIMTHRRDVARKIDRAVFPGEQGGPHLNTIAALAVALKLAKSEQFVALQQRIVSNARRLAQKLSEHGLRIVGGGSENHLLLVDCKSVSANGVHLSGDMAARILDVAGIVLNRNTIPGDKGAFNPTGLRIGTVWISQLGFGDAEVDLLAEAIATVLKGCTPFTYAAPGGKTDLRAKVSYAALQHGRALVRQLRRLGDVEASGSSVAIRGDKAGEFLNLALASDVAALGNGGTQGTYLFVDGEGVAGVVQRVADDQYHLHVADKGLAGETAVWLQALSDGYAQFDDLHGKLPGPVVVTTFTPENPVAVMGDETAVIRSKPYFVGQQNVAGGEPLPAFSWEEPADPPLLRTQLYDTHVALGGKMVPFGGYEMPVWYGGVSEEHRAVREAAGLFDVSHMGVLEASGPHVVDFLNAVTTNDVTTLANGRSQYTYLLFPDGSVVDDLLVYRRSNDRFLLVVNASNNDKDWAWLNAVNEGRVVIDEKRPFARITHPVTLRDLRDPAHGADCRVDIALQGPNSLNILLALGGDSKLLLDLKKLPWAGLLEGTLGGFDLIISRTGYTGERIAYELFVHPDQAVDFWNALLAVGQPFGLKPCGLAARDSTRTEAGLPLYGHELAGSHNLTPGDAGFASFLKLWKPFFIGRDAFIASEGRRSRELVRFRMNEKGVRRPETGDPILDKRGKVIGHVTSCALDSEGYLLGQAIVPADMGSEGTQLSIYQTGGGSRALKLPNSNALGQRFPVPDGATVLSRFPNRKK